MELSVCCDVLCIECKCDVRHALSARHPVI